MSGKEELRQLSLTGATAFARRGVMILDDYYVNGDDTLREAIGTGCFRNLSFPRESKALLEERSEEFRTAFIQQKRRGTR